VTTGTGHPTRTDSSTVLTAADRRAIERMLNPPRCGTPDGYRGHALAHEQPCGDCSAAWELAPGTEPVERDTCATNRGWMDHRWRMERPCDRCLKARAAHELELCGSYAGWMLHRNNGTPVCPRCAEAARQYNASLRGGVVGKRARPSPEALRINPATVTGRLRRAALAGVRLVCTQEPYVGREAVYAPRSRTDKYPWRVSQDPPHYVTAAFLAAVHPATESE
jgi:hypothetical protein